MRRINAIFGSSLLALAAANFATAQLPVDDGLILWLDATDENSLTLDGDFVEE